MKFQKWGTPGKRKDILTITIYVINNNALKGFTVGSNEILKKHFKYKIYLANSLSTILSSSSKINGLLIKPVTPKRSAS